MDLYLIRHADALALGERGITEDDDRPLSEAGEIQAQHVSKTLQKKGVSLDKLVTSPLLRARQTAEWIVKAWNGKAPETVICDELAPGGGARKLARFLRNQGGEHVGLLGHIPHLAEWAGWLIGSKKAQIDFAKAGFAHITCGDGPRKGRGVLQWLVTPEWFEV
ncbi:MAG: phosphohistidine phosphatase SixA [Planctomycetes bacterium]|nr:phosphohistidine phosphatase SixA [Planctomycetota bacterium]